MIVLNQSVYDKWIEIRSRIDIVLGLSLGVSRFAVVCFMLLSLIFYHYGFAQQELPQKTYRIATVTWMGWSPLQVAREKGFWKDIGIDVEVIIYDDPIVIIEAIKANRIDFAMDMAGSLAGVYMQGQNVIALAETNWSHGGDKIIVKKETSIEDFKGEPIGVFLKLPSILYFLGQYLNRHGLKLTDFRIVEIKPDDLSAQFIAGRLPVIVNYDPYAIDALTKGNGIALANSSEFEGCIPECLFTYRNTLNEIPKKDIVKILLGWIRAADWVNDLQNWDEYETILNDHTFAGHPPYTREQLKAMFAAVKIHRSFELMERNRDGGGLIKYFQALYDFQNDNELLTKDFHTEDLFDNRFILEALNLYQTKPE